MALTFSRHLPNIRDILRKKRYILHRSEKMRAVFPSDPMVAYRRGRNLKDMLVHSKTRGIISNRGTKERGRESCGKECVICRRMVTEDETIEGAQGRMTTYDKTIGCKSVNVIYGIWCGVCKRVCYVGETGGCLYTRVQNHLSSIRAIDPVVSLPVRSHFGAPGHGIGDVKVVGLERVWRRSVDYRRVRERRWMYLLGTQGTADGLNKRYG